MNKINVCEIIATADVPKILETLPDWVYDKHTRAGKKLNRGYKHFFESSLQMDSKVYPDGDPYEEETKLMYLANENKSEKMLKSINLSKIKIVCNNTLESKSDSNSTNSVDLGKRIREDDSKPQKNLKKLKKTEENNKTMIDTNETSDTLIKLEDEFQDFLQAQLITRKGSPRVYFCHYIKNNEVKVIKGPCKDIKNYMITQHLKEYLGLDHCYSYKKFYNSGVFEPSNGYFLISSCVGMLKPYDSNNYEIKGITLEKDAKISANKICY